MLLSPVAARADYASAVVVSKPDQSQIAATAYFWHDKPAQATIEQASALGAAGRYAPLAQETMFDLRPEDSLWIRLDVDRRGEATQQVVVWMPIALIDSVTLYRPLKNGGWQTAIAGDRIAVLDWPEPGRYPRFRLDLPAGKSSIYLQARGSTPLTLPIHLGSQASAQDDDRQGFLGLGSIVGVLLSLMLMCIVTAYTYQDRLYLLYSLYVVGLMLSVGAYTGLSAYLLWNQSPQWADAAPGALAALTAGGTLYFIEAIVGGRQFARQLSIALFSLGALSVPLAAAYYFVPRTAGVTMLGAYMFLVTSIGLTLAIRAWQRGDKVGKWVFFAYAPLAFAVLVAIARAVGLITAAWVAQYGLVLALLIEAPMMMVALNVRSRARHEIRTREQAMTTRDPLTGLLREHIFDDRLRQTLMRGIKRREDAAIVLISLVNYEAIALAHGTTVAEHSVLRAVIKLRKVLHDVETVARVGTSHFGVILEGVGHRSSVTNIGARLIAQGLMPLPGLMPEVTLQFHIAAALLRDMPAEQLDMKAQLIQELAAMGRRTRRPIRFWVPTTTGGTPLQALPSAGNSVDQLAAELQAASTVATAAAAQRGSGGVRGESSFDSSNRENSSTPASQAPSAPHKP